jgi:hypothetical protein
MAINPTALANAATQLLPPTITGPIFNKAVESSAVMSLARRVPLSVSSTTTIPVPMDIPIADWVGEGAVKTGGQVGVGVKAMTGKKLAVLVPVSDEVVTTNPGGLYDQLQQDLPTALSRAFDYAAITGLSLKTGSAGPFADYVSLTPNTVALGTALQAAGGIYTDLVTGVGKIVDQNFDMTGWAADPRLQIDAMLATDTQGRPLLSDSHSTSTNDATGNSRSLLGWPAVFNKGVSGRYWRAGDAIQTITITGPPTGGAFTVNSGGNSYVAAWNVTTAALQAAIRAWGGIYATVTVTGTTSVSYVITFTAITSNVSAASAPVTVVNALTGNSAKTSVAASGAGGVDSTIRAVAGDWSQAAYGVGMDITVKVSTEANYFDGTSWHSAFQENLTLLLVEAYYGFVLGSPAAFTVYTKGSATF